MDKLKDNLMEDMFNLSGKTALVTGGGFGIGRSLCQGLAAYGASVAVVDINEDSAQETVAIIEKYGNGAMAVKADISESDEVAHMVAQTVDAFGKLDIAVNNAGGIFGRYQVHDTPEDLWDKILRVNLKGVFLCAKAEIAQMLKQEKGSIINTASVGAILPGDADMLGTVYDSAKGGVITFTRKTAGEYGQHNIRINAIAPGMISGTAFAAQRRKKTPPEVAQKLQAGINRIALRRPGTPDEMKGIVVYLASDAASYTTGQVFVIDGGLS